MATVAQWEERRYMAIFSGVEAVYGRKGDIGYACCIFSCECMHMPMFRLVCVCARLRMYVQNQSKSSRCSPPSHLRLGLSLNLGAPFPHETES